MSLNIEMFGIIDCGKIAQEMDWTEIEKLYTVVLGVLCLSSSDNKMVDNISLIEDKYKDVLGEFIQVKVFDVIDGKQLAENSPLTPHSVGEDSKHGQAKFYLNGLNQSGGSDFGKTMKRSSMESLPREDKDDETIRSLLDRVGI